MSILSNRTFLRVILIVCILVFAVSLSYLGYQLYIHLNQRNIETEIGNMWDAGKEQVTATPSPTPAQTPDTTPTGDPGDDPTGEPVESERDKERRLLLETEALGKEIHADILAVNSDFLGMIEIPGVIDKQPYVMSHDNAEYLRLDFNGNRSATGTIFLNMLNDRLLMDNNSVFFGHYTETGSMFARLLRFKNASTFANSPVIILDSLIGESTWIIFSAHVVEPEAWWMIPYSNEDDYANHLEELKSRSLFITDVDVTPDDRMITLSVCDYTHEDMRFVVHARKLRPGEEVPESIMAEPNPDRKDFTIPHQTHIRDVDMTGAAFAVNPSTGRYFYFTPDAGRVIRYSGGTGSIQGPFTALTNSNITKNTYMAVEIVRVRDDEDARAAYIAIQGFGGSQGITLFTTPSPTGSLRLEGLVTAEGVDARYPTIQNIGGTLWLYYSVPGDNGSSAIYRQHVRGGSTEHLCSVAGVPDARPLGIYTVYDQSVLVWHEASGGGIYGTCIGIDEAFSIGNAGSGARVTLYGSISDTSVNCVIESEGKLSFTSINLGVTPAETPSPVIPDPGEPVQ